MKLLCVVPSYLPAVQFGGPIVSLHGLAKALATKGVDVTVCTTDSGARGKVGTGKATVIDGVKVIYFPFSPLFECMGPTGWQYSPAMSRYLDGHVADFDVVYILSVWNYPVAAAARCCRKHNIPYIISPRGMLYPYMFNKKQWKKFLYYRLVSRNDLEKAAAIHYTSADEAEKCHSRLGFKNKAIIVPNGLDPGAFNALPAKEAFAARYPALKGKKAVLFLGRIHWKKGLDLLVPAFGELARRRDDIRLVIAGNDEGSFIRQVRRWVEDAGIGEKALFTGMLTGEEKLEALAGSDVFALPSYSENFGMAVVEAMACGLPVVISDQVAICKEVKEAGAGIVVRNDAKDLAGAIGRLLNDEELAGRMGEAGRRLVKEQFNWDIISDKMVRSLEALRTRQGPKA